MAGVRERYMPLLWAAIWPLRQYVRYSPVPRGKGFMTRKGLIPVLPPSPSHFSATLPGGGTISIQYRSVIGLSILLNGGFETEETDVLRRHAKPGTVAIDVGANIGMFTVPLAQAVDPQGSVLAFEPLPANVDRLKANVARNNLNNVEIQALALGDSDGTTTLHLSDDPAYCSTVEVSEGRANGRLMAIPAARLDSIWQEQGRPNVSVMKIDVEGGEIAVLAGSEQLLTSCRPVLLLEANSPEQLHCLARHLSRSGYTYSRPSGFMPWNYLFISPGGGQ